MFDMRHTKEATEIALLFFIYSNDVHEISIPITLYFYLNAIAIIYIFIHSKSRIRMVFTWLIRIDECCFCY